MGKDLKQWDAKKFSPEYYKKKGVLKVEDNDYVRTIDDACEICGTKATHLGFLRSAWAVIKGDEVVWCPNKDCKNWANELSKDEKVIREISAKDKTELLNKYEKRVTFFKDKGRFGKDMYRFVGVFKLKSMDGNVRIWQQISNHYPL